MINFTFLFLVETFSPCFTNEREVLKSLHNYCINVYCSLLLINTFMHLDVLVLKIYAFLFFYFANMTSYIMNFLLFRIIFCLNSISFYISVGVLICIRFCWHTKYCFSLPCSAHATVSGRLLQIHKVNFLSSVSIFFLFKNMCSHRMSFS